MKRVMFMIALILMVISVSSLFASTDPVVLRLHAYIPERVTVSATDTGFTVNANSDNFSYAVIEEGMSKTLVMTAR